MRYEDRPLAGLLLLLGSAQFLLAMLVAEGSLPSYSVSTNAISDLGVGPTAALFNSSIILLGLLTLAGAYFYHRTHGVMWITVPFLLAGIGPIGVGLFTENVLALHAIFAFTSFLFGGLLPILISKRLPSPLRYVSILLGALGLVALVLFVTGNYLGIGFGGMERFIVYPDLFWEIAFGAYLMAASEATSAPAAPGTQG